MTSYPTRRRVPARVPPRCRRTIRERSFGVDLVSVSSKEVRAEAASLEGGNERRGADRGSLREARSPKRTHARVPCRAGS